TVVLVTDLATELAGQVVHRGVNLVRLHRRVLEHDDVAVRNGDTAGDPDGALLRRCRRGRSPGGEYHTRRGDGCGTPHRPAANAPYHRSALRIIQAKHLAFPPRAGPLCPVTPFATAARSGPPLRLGLPARFGKDP